MMPVSDDQVVNALKRLTKEVGYMLEAPTKDLVISAETRLAFDQAVTALVKVIVSKYDDYGPPGTG